VLYAGVLGARRVRVQLWYDTASGETGHVVTPDPADLPRSEFGESYAVFVCPPQETGGELRFPRLGEIMWDGGSQPAQPRVPNITLQGVAWIGADSALTTVYNVGGWAYGVVVTLDGVGDVSPTAGRIGYRTFATFRSVARESAGVMLLPRVAKIRWEDYGGVRDSVIAPVGISG
jgi:hypothetical protein